MYTFVKTHLIIHLKQVHFIGCKLYGNEVNFKSFFKKSKTKLTPITQIKENHFYIFWKPNKSSLQWPTWEVEDYYGALSLYCITSVLYACVLSCFCHVWLCNTMVYSPPGSSVHGILQARILEWVAIHFSRDLPDPGIELRSPALFIAKI